MNQKQQIAIHIAKINKNMNKKTTKKNKVKPAYIVDITECKDLYDVALAFALAKQEAKQPLTNDDIDIICINAIDQFAEALDKVGIIKKENHCIESACNVICECDVKQKKLPWYKKLWNTLKRPFTR